jgi:hypothetical protein
VSWNYSTSEDHPRPNLRDGVSNYDRFIASLDETSKMRLRVAVRLDELNKTSFTPHKLSLRKPPPKQFVAQPNPIGIDNIGFT